MTSAFAKKAGLKVFEQHLQKYQPADPIYETYVDAKGRTKRRRVRSLIFSSYHVLFLGPFPLSFFRLHHGVLRTLALIMSLGRMDGTDGRVSAPNTCRAAALCPRVLLSALVYGSLANNGISDRQRDGLRVLRAIVWLLIGPEQTSTRRCIPLFVSRVLLN